MNFFLLLNTKDILKNVGNQTVDTPLTSIVFFLFVYLFVCFFLLWKSIGSINCFITDILQISYRFETT